MINAAFLPDCSVEPSSLLPGSTPHALSNNSADIAAAIHGALMAWTFFLVLRRMRGQLGVVLVQRADVVGVDCLDQFPRAIARQPPDVHERSTFRHGQDHGQIGRAADGSLRILGRPTTLTHLPPLLLPRQ